jgi:superfamily I DNA/RNA helicase
MLSDITSYWDKPGSKIRIIGLAGVGKTYGLAEVIAWANLIKGVKLDDITFISFTKAAIEEIKNKLRMVCNSDDRFIEKIDPHRRKNPLGTANISTLHSWCWHNIVKDKIQGDKKRNVFYSIEQYAREMRMNAEAMEDLSSLRSHGKITDDMKDPFSTERDLAHYLLKKADRYDYVDVIDIAAQSEPSKYQIQLLIVDESQDLTEKQWLIINKHLMSRSDMTLLAGDVSQSIYLWNGARPDIWMGTPVDHEIIMRHTRRIPASIIPLANAFIKNEDLKLHLHPENKGIGSVRLWSKERAIQFLMQKSENPSGDVLVLSLSNGNLRRIGVDLISEGVLFSFMAGDSFKSLVTEDDWAALKFYSMLKLNDLDHEEYIRDIGRMLRRSRHYFDIWRRFTGSEDKHDSARFNREFGEIKVHVRNTLVPLLTPIDDQSFFNSCFADHTTGEFGNKFYAMRDYYLQCYRGGYEEPRIKLSTVHRAKGLECETVILFMDKDKIWQEREKMKLYLNAICRAREHLVIAGPYEILMHDLLRVQYPLEWQEE